MWVHYHSAMKSCFSFQLHRIPFYCYYRFRFEHWKSIIAWLPIIVVECEEICHGKIQNILFAVFVILLNYLPFIL